MNLSGRSCGTPDSGGPDHVGHLFRLCLHLKFEISNLKFLSE